MTPPILLSKSTEPFVDSLLEEKAQTIENLLPLEEDTHPLLEELLSLCKENINKKITPKKPKESPPITFAEVEFFLTEGSLPSQKQKNKKIENDLSPVPEIPVPFLRPHLSGQYTIKTPSISEESMILLDKMCSEMLIMTSESSSKTILVLETKEFANSPFYGAELTLEEFSTAPKVFNISIRASTPAVTLIQTHLAGFMQLLQERNFSFGVNRIDTSISTKSSLSKKKQDKFPVLGKDPEEERTL